jgi:putative transposase
MNEKVEQTSSSVHKVIYIDKTLIQSPYKPIDEFTITRRNLPHWQSPGSVYLITFRTFNGLILDEYSRQILYDAILFQDNQKCKIFSFVIMPDHVHIILRPMELKGNVFHNLSEIMKAIKGYSAKQIIKYLSQAQTGTSVPPINNSSSNIVAQTSSSVSPLKHIFQDESFDRIIRNDKEFFEKLNYVLNNPVKRGLIENGYAYKWYYLYH